MKDFDQLIRELEKERNARIMLKEKFEELDMLSLQRRKLTEETEVPDEDASPL